MITIDAPRHFLCSVIRGGGGKPQGRTLPIPPTGIPTASVAVWRPPPAPGKENKSQGSLHDREIAAIPAMGWHRERRDLPPSSVSAYWSWIFAVTRVIFVPLGDIAASPPFPSPSLETGTRPGTMGLVAGLAVIATLVGASLAWAGVVGDRRAPSSSIVVLPLLPAAAVWLAAGM